MRYATVPERIAARHDIDAKTGCWNWTGHVSQATGYGQTWDGEKVVYAHRASYEQHVGPIPCRTDDRPSMPQPRLYQPGPSRARHEP